ncbi:hypothetical protein Bca4012_014205 [Brassica carinata]
MALISHRLRQALVTATSCLKRSALFSPSSNAPTAGFPPVSTVVQRSVLGRLTEAPRAPVRLFSTRQYKLYNEITEETLLFEGCDFNHWLITMDFPKDNPLSPEEMVSTYEQTCASGLGIRIWNTLDSLEEAKKKMYACSTTTYQGFQAVMTKQESEKFEDLPGVVFVLPDSYIDAENKEYGGDKYENGVITHRPPPFQPNRRTRERFNQRSDRQGGSPQNFQRNNQYGQQPPMQCGGGGYGGPQQSNGPPGQGNQAPPPPYQGGYNQGSPRSPSPPYQAGYNQGQGSPVPPYQGSPGGYSQSGPGNYSQGPQGGYNQGGPRNGSYGAAPGAGNPNLGYGQGYTGPGQELNQTIPPAGKKILDRDMMLAAVK